MDSQITLMWSVECKEGLTVVERRISDDTVHEYMSQWPVLVVLCGYFGRGIGLTKTGVVMLLSRSNPTSLNTGAIAVCPF